jgi:hypothetical protein
MSSWVKKHVKRPIKQTTIEYSEYDIMISPISSKNNIQNNDSREGVLTVVSSNPLVRESTHQTIYMTYKKTVPAKVINRWKNLNQNYNIEFSLDRHCINFLEKNFNKYISNLFISIKTGMYKADLWRLCKLYKNSGVYADVDLVPYLNIDILDKDITFYSCLSIVPESVFQAFMVIFSKPKNPLLLVFLLSFLINKPWKYHDGPTFDMYNCIKYMLNREILPERKYELDVIKIQIKIGASNTNTKRINLYYFPDDIQYNIKLNANSYNEEFDFKIIDNELIVQRLDTNTGWVHSYSVDICFDYKANFYFFAENIGHNNDSASSYVTFKNKKILDSRDLEYQRNKGW